MSTSGAIGHVVPVILSGGSGTRLWPVSRSGQPKQLIALTGEHTMLQATAHRTRDASRFAQPMVVANFAHASQITQQLDEVGLTPAALILEPVARNTAPGDRASCASSPRQRSGGGPAGHAERPCRRRRCRLRSSDRRGAAGRRRRRLAGNLRHCPDRTGNRLWLYQAWGVGSRPASIVRSASSKSRIAQPPRPIWRRVATAGTAGSSCYVRMRYLAALETHAPEIAAAAKAAMDGAVRDGPVVHPDRQAFAASLRNRSTMR